MTPVAAAAQKADPAVYGALPIYDEIQISPDGSTLAMIQNIAGGTGIIFQSTTPGGTPSGINLGDNKARDLVWASNDYALALLSQTERVSTSGGLKTLEFFRWISVPRDKPKANVFFRNEGGYYIADSGDLLALVPSKPDHVLFSRLFVGNNSGGPSRLGGDGIANALFEGNLSNGSVKRIEASGAADWVFNPEGDIVARVQDSEGGDARILMVRDGGSFVERARFSHADGRPTINFIGLTPDRSAVYASQYVGDFWSLTTVSLATGAVSLVNTGLSGVDFDGVVQDLPNATAAGVLYTDDLPRRRYLDADIQKTQDALAKAIPGAAPIIESRTADGSKMIVRAVYSDHPDQFFLYDKAAKALNMIAPSYQALDGKVVAGKEPYHYTSPDGLKIHGYLTVPKDAARQSMPLIVLPHGGPEARDDMSFDWWSFFYAARGYLVYQPNFRGSDGYGLRFRSAGYGEWGRKMQDDVTNGVKKLIAEGVVDPERICIVGASYGGYAALVGATLTPDLYACAVSVNGVSGLASQIAYSEDRGGAGDYWTARAGSRFKERDQLDAISPAKIADRAGAPIMLIHGKDDTVVPFGQSLVMRDALRAAGKPVELVELKGEDHWLSRGPSRTEMLAKSIEFIDRHIGQ